MKDLLKRRLVLLSTVTSGVLLIGGCGAQPGGTNVNLANSSTNTSSNSVANSNTNSNASNSSASVPVETNEPSQYQAIVSVRFEAIGDQQKTTLPTLNATVARSGDDRRMEFNLPTGGSVIFVDKGGMNYILLPQKKQYAELNRESVGFDVRRMLMPEQIVNQVKALPGVQRIGEETYNGRDVVRYKYGAVADTQSKAGQIATDSYLLVDKQTGLPLHSETLSQSQSGANVQGMNGIRVITEIADVKTDVSPSLFEQPTDYQKIDASQVKSQVDMIFNALSAFMGQMIKQAQPAGSPTATPAG